MKTSDFYYDLPQDLIAQTPVEPRDSSRLMVVNRQKTVLNISIFMILLTICKKVTVLLPTIQEYYLQEFTVHVQQEQKLNFCC